MSIIVLLLAGGIAGTTTGLFRALAAEDQAVADRDAKDKALQKETQAQLKESEAIQKETRALQNEAQARQIEAAARKQTRLALNTMTDEVLEDLLGRPPQLTEKHREFLKKVLAYHAEFAAAKADDPERAARVAPRDISASAASARPWVIYPRQRRHCVRPSRLQKPLVNEFPGRHDLRLDLVHSYLELGHCMANIAWLVETRRRRKSSWTHTVRRSHTLDYWSPRPSRSSTA